MALVAIATTFAVHRRASREPIGGDRGKVNNQRKVKELPNIEPRWFRNGPRQHEVARSTCICHQTLYGWVLVLYPGETGF